MVGVPHPDWGEVVKATVVRRPGSHLTPDDARDFVGKELASYKKPRIVEFLDELPVTPTGKVDRTLLRLGAATGSPIRASMTRMLRW